MAVKIKTLPNGILFETTGVPGSGMKIASKKFTPKNYPNIIGIDLFDDYVLGLQIDESNFKLNMDGSGGAYPISHIDNVVVVSVSDIFDKLIAIL